MGLTCYVTEILFARTTEEALAMGWHHVDLNVASQGAPLATSDPAGYTWSADQTQHVVYRDAAFHIHELWFKGGLWNHADLHQEAGLGLLPVVGEPDGYAWDEVAPFAQHVVFRQAGGQQRIHELTFVNDQWRHKDLMAAAGNVGDTAMSNPVCYVWDVDKTRHVIFRDGVGRVHELWNNGQWHHSNLTLATQGGPAPVAVGDPFGYTWDVDKTQHVVYRGADNHIHELFFKDWKWHHSNLTLATQGGPAPVAVGNPFGYTWDVDKTQHVVYRGADNHIHELFFKDWKWHHSNLTLATQGGPAPVAVGDPFGYTWDVDKTQHVVYRGADNHIHELFFKDWKWHHNDLTFSAGGAPLAAGDPAGYTWDVDQTQHVVYRGADNHIHELWFHYQR
ncbi:hypothetical protein [Streptomyces swartbergensis]|uniref:hypothetical protein n=1 Tax=Streptomyces swartbergensis TaxID=487165 RepID=UPI00382410E5